MKLKRKRHTRSNQCQTRFMGIKRLVNGHDREPKTWHEYIDEDEGSKEAQCHEAQHGSRAPVRAPLRYGAVRGRCMLPQQNGQECVLTNYSSQIAETNLSTMTSKLLSALTVTTIGLTSKAFLNSGLCSIQVNGLQNLKDALKSHNRNSGQGIITGSCYFNHNPSTC